MGDGANRTRSIARELYLGSGLGVRGSGVGRTGGIQYAPESMTRTSDRRPPPGSSISAGAFLCLLALLLGLTGWLFTGAFVSFVDPAGPDAVEYLLVARPASELTMWCLGALGLLLAWQAAFARRLFRLPHWQDAPIWPSVASLSPLLLLALPAAALAMLATPLGTFAPPSIYLFIDLRWWLLAGIVALLAIAVSDRRAEHAPKAPAPGRFPAGSVFCEVLVGAILLAATLVSSPKD